MSAPSSTVRGSSARRLGVVLAVVASAIVCWTVLGGLPYQADPEGNVRASLAAVDRFMVAGEAGATAQAQAEVASWPTGSDLDRAGVEDLVESRGQLFDGYVAVDRATYGISLRTTWRGTDARIDGTVSYDDGTLRPYQAVLVKRNNAWKLTSLSFS